MNTLIYDIEADELLEKVSVIHCIVTKSLQTGEVNTYDTDHGDIEEGITALNEADGLIAHSGMAYDDKAILKLHGVEVKTTEDTLLMSRAAYPNRKELDFNLARSGKIPKNMIGRHSLESWGYRLGFLKGDYGKQENAWEKFTPEMLEYCIQDVEVTARLYDRLMKLHVQPQVYQVEVNIARICQQQEINGFPFDFHKAVALHQKILKRKNQLSSEITEVLGGVWIYNLGEVIPKRTIRYKKVLQADRTEGCPFTQISIKEFNPTSRAQVAKRLVERVGWEPTIFGTDGVPELSETTIKTIEHPIKEILAEQFMLQIRLGQMAEGRQGYMKVMKPDGRIHGRINPMGTVTSRATHSSPNMSAVPANDKPWGKEFRELFTAPKGMLIFGTDISGLEARMLSHYMWAWDDGAYADILLNGDIHTENQKATGLATRPSAKTFFYALLYGSGDENLGEVINESLGIITTQQKNRAKGKAARAKLYKGLPALGALTDAVKAKAKALGYLKGIDGRAIPVRSQHSALNSLLQCAGSVVSKYWIVNIHNTLKELGYIDGKDYQQLSWSHDDIQLAFDPVSLNKETLHKISQDAIELAAKQLKIRLPLAVDSNVGINWSETH